MAEPQGVHPVQIAPPGEVRGPLQAQGANCWLESNARTPGQYLAGGSLLCAVGWRACCFLRASAGAACAEGRRNENKDFRGWGCGGGDPFAKWALPHKNSNAHRPVKSEAPCRLRASIAGLNQTPEPPVIIWPGVLCCVQWAGALAAFYGQVRAQLFSLSPGPWPCRFFWRPF